VGVLLVLVGVALLVRIDLRFHRGDVRLCPALNISDDGRFKFVGFEG
jgi:hypothetical protein